MCAGRAALSTLHPLYTWDSCSFMHHEISITYPKFFDIKSLHLGHVAKAVTGGANKKGSLCKKKGYATCWYGKRDQSRLKPTYQHKFRVNHNHISHRKHDCVVGFVLNISWVPHKVA